MRSQAHWSLSRCDRPAPFRRGIEPRRGASFVRPLNAGGLSQRDRLHLLTYIKSRPVSGFQIHHPPVHCPRMSNQSLSFDFDVAVIGGGSGGYAAARTAAAAGLRTAVIEGGKEVGEFLDEAVLARHDGCMPTKALLYAAEIRHLAQYAALWGMKPGDVPFDWSAVMARKDGLIKEFADYRAGQLADGRFQFLRAQARFVDPNTLALSTGGTLTAAHFILSTGSVVSAPPLPQLASVGYLTSDEALTLKRPPKSLIVLGGGAVAVEFAQFFARFDVKVTLVQRGPRLLRDCDDDAALAVEKVFRREGIDVFTCTMLTDAWRDGGTKGVTFTHEGKQKRVAAEEILFALGRSPNTASLALAKAGVTTDKGRVIANARMQTSAPHIYAAGDCTGPYEIVHIAIQQGEIAAHNIAHPDRPRATDFRLLLSVVFTDPQVAMVGLTEKEARARGVKYLAASYPFADHGKSLIMEARDGFVKLLADPKTGEILGGSCVGPMGGELIHEIAAAMAKRMTVAELAALPHYHPTLAEIWTYPAEELAEKAGSEA
jgi:pyruvate/2-oxoglutarate dehydrogenase complex dihydrolipoamide dehydrogenase (E3) component